MHANSKGVKKRPVSVASTGVKVLRFDTDPRTVQFLGKSSDSQRLLQRFLKDCSKGSIHSTINFTIELYAGQQKIVKSEKLFEAAEISFWALIRMRIQG
jgi:hypothetical protein